MNLPLLVTKHVAQKANRYEYHWRPYASLSKQFATNSLCPSSILFSSLLCSIHIYVPSLSLFHGIIKRTKMAKHTAKHPLCTTSTIVFALACFLGAALILDVLWASSSTSSSAYISLASNWARDKSQQIIFANQTQMVDAEDNKDRVPTKFLSATFADLPGPELHWEAMAPAPVPRLDGSAAQIKDLFYVFAGYRTLDFVHSHVDIYNITNDTWVGRIDIPKEMSNSHLGMVNDGRYVYIVSGQFGPQCRTPPRAHVFVLDTETKEWHKLPPLPAPRYAPATQIWRGRLHVMGGSMENRHTPGKDHWSIAVKNGKALEEKWKWEVPIPRGGPHRACVVVGDRLYVIGGQEGDFMPKPGSPIFKCSRRNEVVYGDVYMLDDKMKWKELPPMPKPDSHIESSWVLVNNSIVIVGGTTEKHPVNKRMILVGELFRFDLNTLKWSVIGKLPYRIKTTMAAYWDGWLYFTSGQRDRGPDNPQPREVVGDLWRTKLSF